MTRVPILLCLLVLWTSQVNAISNQDEGDEAALPHEEEEIFWTFFTNIDNFLKKKTEKIAEKIQQKTNAVNKIKESKQYPFDENKRFTRDLSYVENYLKNKFEKIAERIRQKVDTIDQIKKLKQNLNEDQQNFIRDVHSMGYDMTKSLTDKFEILKSKLDQKAQIITDKIAKNVPETNSVRSENSVDASSETSEDTVDEERDVVDTDEALATTVSSKVDFNLKGLLKKKQTIIQQKFQNKMERIENALESTDQEKHSTYKPDMKTILDKKQEIVQNKIQNKMNRIYKEKSNTDEKSSENDSKATQDDDSSSEINDESTVRDEHVSEDDDETSESNNKSSEKDGESSNSDNNSAENDHNSSNNDNNSAENDHNSAESNDNSSENEQNSSHKDENSSENDDNSSKNEDNNSSDSDDKSSDNDDNSSEEVVNKLYKRAIESDDLDLLPEIVVGFILKTADTLAKKEAFSKARTELYNFTKTPETIGEYGTKLKDMMAKKRDWIRSKIALKAEMIETLKNISVKLADYQGDETETDTVRTKNLSNQNGIHMALASTNDQADHSSGSSATQTVVVIGCLALAVTSAAVIAVYFGKGRNRRLYSHM